MHASNSKLLSINLGGRSPLHDACNSYDREKIRELLASGNDPNAKDVNGQSPIHVLLSDAFYGYMHQEVLLEIMETLVERGCDINLRDNDGESPLCVAVHNKLELCASYLVKSGACTNVRSVKFSGMHNLAHNIALTMPNVMLEILDSGVAFRDGLIHLDWSRVLQYSAKEDELKHLKRIKMERESTFLDSLYDVPVDTRIKYLTHPLIAAFVHAKSQKLRRSSAVWIVRLILGIYPFLFLLFLYFMYVDVCGLDRLKMTYDEEEEVGVDAEECSSNVPLRIFSIFLLVFAILYGCVEGLLLIRSDIWNVGIRNWRTWAKGFTVILMIISLIPGIIGRMNIANSDATPWYYPTAALCTFFTCVMIIIQLESLPGFKVYYEMLAAVLVSVVKIIVVFIPLLFGFWMGFSITFVDAESNFILNFVSMAVDVGSNARDEMIIGARYDGSIWFRIMTSVFLIAFIIVIGIVFMNFLLAKSISDVQKLKHNAKVVSMSNRIHTQFVANLMFQFRYNVVSAQDVENKEWYFSYEPSTFQNYFPEVIHRKIMFLLKTKGIPMSKMVAKV